MIDLSIQGDIENKIYRGFGSDKSESVKWAASYALGNIAVGNMNKYVKVLLKLINDNPDRQYLLLNSLKEIISEAQNEMKPYTESVVPLLLDNANSNDDGIRSMVAECLGKFAFIEPSIYQKIEIGNLT